MKRCCGRRICCTIINDDLWEGDNWMYCRTCEDPTKDSRCQCGRYIEYAKKATIKMSKSTADPR